eukprot:TRINITY_DN23010_c0_g1_i1.p1 TRINITY_DN23010_c0_g1~~TRINITY_DN23010_c0_g1_i1.p1  ORF type:complete len:372 (-),score=97.32 TRINITY_DN23010_c0_g1_i1:532-1563(-)
MGKAASCLKCIGKQAKEDTKDPPKQATVDVPEQNTVDVPAAAADGKGAATAGTADRAKKAKIGDALLKAVGEGAMKAAILSVAEGGQIDLQKVYDAALEGAMKGAREFGAKLGAQAVNVAILQASQYAAMVVLSEATKEAGRQTVYFGAGSITQTALAGCAGMAAAISPMTWAAIVGELSGKAVAWATKGDPKVAGLIGAVSAGALAGAFVGSNFGPAGTLAGLVGGAAVGTTQFYMGQLIEWFLEQVEDMVTEKLAVELDLDDIETDVEVLLPLEDGTDWRKRALEKMPKKEEGDLCLLCVKLRVDGNTKKLAPTLLDSGSNGDSKTKALLGGTIQSTPVSV